MTQETTSVALTPQELQVIQAALHTQEKILTVQNRAGIDRAVARRLDDLKSVLRNVKRQTPSRTTAQSQPTTWSQMARTLFC